MRLLYLDCSMGAAGDMLMAALYELLEEKGDFLRQMNALFPELLLVPERVIRGGVLGTHMSVRIGGVEERLRAFPEPEGRPEPELHDWSGIRDRIGALTLPARVKEEAQAVYAALADAESRVHGCRMEEIHFHEVGSLDAVADVVGVCYLKHLLRVARILSSPIVTGWGSVHCAHGILPIPAPATAELLRGLPQEAGEIEGELCTPTGAALLRALVDEYIPRPILQEGKMGYGMGKKEFSRPNCLRSFLWEE